MGKLSLTMSVTRTAPTNAELTRRANSRTVAGATRLVGRAGVLLRVALLATLWPGVRTLWTTLVATTTSVAARTCTWVVILLALASRTLR